MGSVGIADRGIDIKRLTDRERRFVLEYLLDYNGKRAAIAAGYSKKVAHVTASKLLRKSKIARAIGRLQRDDVERLELRRDEIIKHLYYAVTRDPLDIYDADGEVLPLDEMSERARACIDSIDRKVTYRKGKNGRTYKTVETHVRLVPKAQALDMAMKHKGLFAPDQHEHIIGPFDWNALIQRGDPRLDPVEQRLLAESKMLETTAHPVSQ